LTSLPVGAGDRTAGSDLRLEVGCEGSQSRDRRRHRLGSRVHRLVAQDTYPGADAGAPFRRLLRLPQVAAPIPENRRSGPSSVRSAATD
jgi:hypothetical protein